MNALKLADIKKRWKESQCQNCQGKRTLMLSPALTFIYEDAPELFKYIEELEEVLDDPMLDNTNRPENAS